MEQLELREETGRGRHGDEELFVPPEETKLGKTKQFFHALVEKRRAQQFFRGCAVINVLSLIFSAPLVQCDRDDECTEHLVSFVVILCVDVVLSVLYSIHAIAKVDYAFYLYKKHKVGL